jgi:hypothetical protein
MNRLWVMRNIEAVAVCLVLTFPIWILPFAIYQLYQSIREAVLEAV